MDNKVAVQVIGGEEKFLSLDTHRTVADVKAAMGCSKHAAKVNGVTQSDDYELKASDYVSLSAPIKGGI